MSIESSLFVIAGCAVGLVVITAIKNMAVIEYFEKRAELDEKASEDSDDLVETFRDRIAMSASETDVEAWLPTVPHLWRGLSLTPQQRRVAARYMFADFVIKYGLENEEESKP